MTPTRNPGWYRAERLHRGRVPAEIRTWLLAGGSLTAHVRACCPGRFGLRILRQRVAAPRRDEAALLGMPPGGRALVREIELCCGTRPLVVARTIIPLASLRGRQQRLAGLGRRPLGALLFADRSARREPYQIARMTLRQAGIARPPRVASPVWGRRAVYRLGGAPLLVSEFFLPVLYDTDVD
ncbi:MAG: chorismate--pyruvate lyase family protein [Halofilum sp. (in: g-proteobacteria)]